MIFRVASVLFVYKQIKKLGSRDRHSVKMLSYQYGIPNIRINTLWWLNWALIAVVFGAWYLCSEKIGNCMLKYVCYSILFLHLTVYETYSSLIPVCRLCLSRQGSCFGILIAFFLQSLFFMPSNPSSLIRIAENIGHYIIRASHIWVKWVRIGADNGVVTVGVKPFTIGLQCTYYSAFWMKIKQYSLIKFSNLIKSDLYRLYSPSSM